MILITDMESGERVFYQGSGPSLSLDGAGTGLVCPAAQPESTAKQLQPVMPALMEHDFGVKR